MQLPLKLSRILYLLLCCCCTWKSHLTQRNPSHWVLQLQTHAFFSLRTDSVCCRLPHVQPGSTTLQHKFSSVYYSLILGKQLSVSVLWVPTSPVLCCLSQLTAFKKLCTHQQVLAASAINTASPSHAKQHPAKELAGFAMHLPICMRLHLAPLALVELARGSVWAQSHPSIWTSAAPSVYSSGSAFV